MADPGERPAPAPLLFSDQTEAQRAEKFFCEIAPSPLSLGLDNRPPLPPPPHLSEGLDPPLRGVRLMEIRDNVTPVNT